MSVATNLLRRRTIGAQVLMIQSATLIITLALGFLVVLWYQSGQLDRQYELRALAIAQSAAASASLQHAVETSGSNGEVQRMAGAIVRTTGVLFVTVTNARGIRLSQVRPSLIGTSVVNANEPAATDPFLTGRSYLGIQNGVLGATARGKAPLFDAHHRLIGEVSVGIPVADVTDTLTDSLPTLGGYMAAVFVIGALLSMALSRRLKRQTFGLELDEIAGLLQERESMLHGIREGLLGMDKGGRVLLVNDHARQLLDFPHGVHGRPIKEILPAGRLRDVILGNIEGPDQVLVIGDRVVVANRMPMRTDYRGHLGWVVTFQDRTESEELLRELDTVAGLAEALRAQSHEFSNRLHTLVGLVEMGQNDEAVAFVTDVTSARNELDMQLVEAFDDTTIAALLLGKSSVANEHGVALSVIADARVRVEPDALADLLRLLGNLVDNATDAASGMRRKSTPPFVEVYIQSRGTSLEVRVSDSGSGVAVEDRSNIFADGWSTKTSRTGARRGLGLALVREIVERHGGTISVSNEIGAVFTVNLPGVLRENVVSDSGELVVVIDNYDIDGEFHFEGRDVGARLSKGRTT